MTVIDDFPFPFEKPMGYQLWRVIASMHPVHLDATIYAQKFGIDPLDLPPNLSTRQLWHVILSTTAVKGTTRDLVVDTLAQNPRSPQATFLKALIDDTPARVSPEPVAGFDPSVTQPEALLFTDDLTIPAGRIPGLIATLQKLDALAPSVCMLKVANTFGDFFGTGFKIGPDLVLTNEHVLFPEKTKAASVQVELGFDVDANGASLPVVSLRADPSTIVGDAADDWAVIRVPGISAALPIIDLASAPVPRENDRAYILQHPDGQQRRLGFVRNTITSVTDDRVQYLTDTQPGSSGAPVLDAEGKLIALHHRGGTPVQKVGKAPLTKNQGVRISRVLAGLKAHGVVD